MKIITKYSNGPTLIEADVHGDKRGYFYESFNEKEFKEKVADVDFVQDNQSKSAYGVVRGLHFQKPPYAQSKLVRVVKGVALDVIVDIRKNSPNFGKIYTAYLSENNHRQFFVPQGFAHGFISLADETIFQYKCDNYYNKESEGSVNIFSTFNGESIPISNYVNTENINLSEKDEKAPLFSQFNTPFN